MAKKILFTILSISVVALVIAFGVSIFSPLKVTGFFTSQDDVSSNVENLYELVNPGADISIEKIEEVSGVYKILLKAVDVSGAVTYKETYISKDGKLLTENMIIVEQSITQLKRVYNFVDCLQGENVMIAGVANHTATILQFNILGGSYATKLYRSCDGQLAQQCIDSGIAEVPSVVYQDAVYPGMQSVQWFENLTACKF